MSNSEDGVASARAPPPGQWRSAASSRCAAVDSPIHN